MTILELKDKSGRLISLNERQWSHILAEHSYLSGSLEWIKDALLAPDKIKASFSDNKVKLYYKYIKSGSKYLLVVVKYLNNHGFIITAFYTNKLK